MIVVRSLTVYSMPVIVMCDDLIINNCYYVIRVYRPIEVFVHEYNVKTLSVFRVGKTQGIVVRMLIFMRSACIRVKVGLVRTKLNRFEFIGVPRLVLVSSKGLLLMLF